MKTKTSTNPQETDKQSALERSAAKSLDELFGGGQAPTETYWRDMCAQYARRLNEMEPEIAALKARIAKLETALRGPLNRAQFGVTLTLTDSEIDSAREALKGETK